MIFYFSATGNCKYVAQRIAEAMEDRTMFIQDFHQLTFELKPDESIGVVSPTYAWGLPHVMWQFLERITFSEPPAYLFFVATYGTTPGNSGLFASELLKRHSGKAVDAVFSVQMPDTWTPLFDLSDSQKVAAVNERAEKEIDSVIVQIKEKAVTKRMRRQTPFFTRVVYKPYYDHMRQTKYFQVDEELCIGCGLCEKKCPVNVIEVIHGHPVWLWDKCVMCLGCLHRCPKFAISYGENTKKHGQYMNPYARM